VNLYGVFDAWSSYSTNTDYSYNAYTNATDPFPNPTGTSHDQAGVTFNWQVGPLGRFYLPTSSALINNGHTNANYVGLYHFTTQTNEVKETNSVVDIGYHYLAVDSGGNATDTDGDGIPDYLEDLNGNGLYDGGDPSNWLLFSTDGTGMSDGWEIRYFGAIGANPNADPDSDGLSNLQEFQFGLNPLVDDSTQGGSRLNYTYDADGWLNTVSGARSGSITLDNQGNIQQVSQ